MVLSTDGAARLGCRSACARGAFGRAVAAAAAMMIAAGGFMAGAAEEAPRAKDTPGASQPNQMPRLGEPFEVLVSEAWPALIDGALRKGSGVVRLGDGTIAAGYFDSAGSFNVMTSRDGGRQWTLTSAPWAGGSTCVAPLSDGTVLAIGAVAGVRSTSQFNNDIDGLYCVASCPGVSG